MATVHTFPREAGRASGPLRKIVLDVRTFDPPVTRSRIGRVTQQRISEHNSDCIDESRCVRIMHKVAAPANTSTGTSPRRRSPIFGIEIIRSSRYSCGHGEDNFARSKASAFPPAPVVNVGMRSRGRRDTAPMTDRSYFEPTYRPRFRPR